MLFAVYLTAPRENSEHDSPYYQKHKDCSQGENHQGDGDDLFVNPWILFF